MSNYKKADADQLNTGLASLADTIRAKTGRTEAMDFLAGDFKTEVESIVDVAVLANGNLERYSSEKVSGAIASSAFSSQPNLVSVNLPNWTGGGSYAFQSCTKLTTVGCQNLQAIGAYCFSGCKSLERIELPSLTYISSGAFNGCSALKTVIIGTENSTNIATLQSIDAFKGTPIADGNGFVYVRDILWTDYRTKWGAVSDTAANWIKTYSDL